MVNKISLVGVVLVSGVALMSALPSHAQHRYGSADCHVAMGWEKPQTTIQCWQSTWHRKPLCGFSWCKTKKLPKYRYKM